MKPRSIICSIFCGALIGPLALAQGNRDFPKIEKTRTAVARPIDGNITFNFSPAALDRYGLWFTPRGHLEDTPAVAGGWEDEGQLVQSRISFPIDPASRVAFDSSGMPQTGESALSVLTCGGLMLFPSEQRVVIGNLSVQRDAGGVYRVISNVDDPLLEPTNVFYLETVLVGFDRATSRFWLMGEVVADPAWAAEIGVPEAGDEIIGTVRIEGDSGSPQPAPGETATCAAALGMDAAANTASVGPDVIVGDLQSTIRYTPRVGDITAYAIGTTSCNMGTERVNWYQYTNQHPVIIQNVYRLDGGGFQQIGMSWLKHGFWAVSQNLCTPCIDPTPGQQLGVGCSDPYSAPLNGDQANMSPRATLNAHTGYFPFPWSGPGWANSTSRRVQIRDADIDPDLNPGARYFLEGHYLTADDSAAGNADNNASYREALVSEVEDFVYQFVLEGARTTQRGQAAVRAWRDVDPSVVETDVRVPGEGLLILAAKAFSIGGGWYRYQYALQNLNSDRAAREFKVELPPGASVQNIGFRDVDHHSGEPFSTMDWFRGVQDGYLTWWSETYEENVNANALRFGSVFSFSFDCNVEPANTKVYIGLFKPGFPGDLAVNSVGPRPECIDCNRNLIPDECDLDCQSPSCATPCEPTTVVCGTGTDCDDNGVPDECQADCNHNGIADACDIRDCPPGDLSCTDCNANQSPDECETDCDGNQIPDDCVPPGDTDGDGVDDCTDLCPENTPAGACQPPDQVICRFFSGMCVELSWFMCLANGGTPMCGGTPETRCEFGVECVPSACRSGCMLGDCDADGDLDLFDVQSLQNCFSGADWSPGYVPPSEECTIPLDFDDDADIDASDYTGFYDRCSGPADNQ